MYLTDVTISLISSLFIQLVIIPNQVISYISRRNDPTRKRFLILSVFFFGFNLLWVCSSTFYTQYEYSQLLKIFGLLLIGAIHRYLQKETRIADVRFSTGRLILLITIVYVLDFLMINANLEILHPFHKWIMAILLELIVALFSSQILVKIIKTKHRQSPMLISSIVVCVLAFLMPIVYVLIESEMIRTIAFNLIYFIIAGAYLKHHIKQLKLETKLVKYNSLLFSSSLTERTRMEILVKEKVELTKRQIIVLNLLLQNFGHQEVADRLYISYEAARKNASNIYKKFGVKSTAELIEVVEYMDYSSQSPGK